MSFRLILKDSLIATVVYTLVYFFYVLVPWKKSFSGSLPGGGDFEIYDLKFTGSLNDKIVTDTNIVLIEIGDSRNEIADQLILLSQYSPKAVGIDAHFAAPGDTLEDLKMAFALNQLPVVITGANFIDTPAAHLDSGAFAHISNTQTAFLNLDAPSDYSVVRSYYPAIKNGKETYESFTTRIIGAVDSAAYKKLLKRGLEREVINYTANLPNYLNISKLELNDYEASGQLDIVKGKIVLLGFFKNAPPDVLDDFRFTPVNNRFFGKSLPDMYGLVIHANILSMALADNYITEVTGFYSWCYAFGFAFLYNVFLFYFKTRKKVPGKRFFSIAQYLIIVLLGYFFLKLFDIANIKVELEPIISLLVISVAMVGVYKKVALYLNKKYNYNTTFKQEKEE